MHREKVSQKDIEDIRRSQELMLTNIRDEQQKKLREGKRLCTYINI